EKRSLLVTITAAFTPTKGLQNGLARTSRPTDQFGTKVTLGPTDLFVMPAIHNRLQPSCHGGNAPKGSITLEGIVTPEGRVTNVRVLDTPDTAYNSRAVDAFRQYKFNPARLNGK